MSQKLTNLLREAFVRGVLADTPSVDYLEMARGLVTKAIVKELPPVVLALYRDEGLRHRLSDGEYINLFQKGFDYSSMRVPGSDQAEVDKAMLKIGGKLKELGGQYQIQNEERAKLKENLQSLIGGFSTVAAAHKALPEFAKYLPEISDVKTSGVPAVIIANTVADLVKKGWPKKEPK